MSAERNYQDVASNAKMAAYRGAQGLIGAPVYSLSTRDRLTSAKAEMLERIAQIDRIIELLDKNADTEELLNLLGRAGY